MTVEHLINLLNSVPDKSIPVVLAKDQEGNGFGHLTDVNVFDYAIEEGQENEYSFEIGIRELTSRFKDQGFDEEDVADGKHCVVLWA